MTGARRAALTRSDVGRAVSRRLDRSLTARRVARRLGLWSPGGQTLPPEAPVGVKLELTHRCNLSCPFCYTDSPRHTRVRTADLGDDEWRAVVEDALRTGIIEAVVTGGEPLLRRELALELTETLAAAGVGVTLNTNGWFVDDAAADRLAALRGLQVNISLDGATAGLHDGARGAPGSWQRAVAAADRLLARGARVRLIHVVTPANLAHLDAVLEHGWLLGVASMRVARVGLVGAAARGGAWDVDSRVLFAAVDRFRGRRGGAMPVNVTTASAASLAALEDVAPAALLVRPNGAVLTDSLSPFRFGSVPAESLAACWARVAATWPHPAVVEWAHSVKTASGLARAEHVPYRDAEVALVPMPADDVAARAVAAERIPSAVPPAPAAVDLDAARDTVVGLALARRYRLGAMRHTGDGAGGRYVRLLEAGRTHRLNATATRVMDACSGGCPADAVELLRELHPGVERAALAADVLGSVRSLVARGIVVPAPA